MVALRKPSLDMTVAEFLEWDSGDDTGALWQLRDGKPEMMVPASDPHAMIQSELGRLIGNHLADSNSPCRVGVAPGVVPRVGAARNLLIPDLGVTCTPPEGGRTMANPVVLIEILSPSNMRQTRANVWAYTSIPSVAEIVLIRSRSIAAEVLRRQNDGSWPDEPEYLGPDHDLLLESIGFRTGLRAVYRTSGIAA
ncbi:MAG TPA: Uma2 family endonuclease [Acetobacteraceae bacterium]|jgi:Uma2 family endonuclease